MANYKVPIEIACIVFPFIALLFTFPFMIHEYRKYGSINILKSLVIYSFILYMITAYFMVIMPLPPIDEVANYTSKTTQLVPFQFISDILQTVNFKLDSFASILKCLKSSTVYTVLFNLILTLPFGIYLKYLFHKKWYQAIIYSFILSLFYELTQLSSLYGIYPRPYRLFDVDDLIINTTGGFIGFILAPLVTLVLPSTDELNNKSLIKGAKVSLLRRIVALFIDFIFLSIFSLLFKIILLNTKLSDYYFILSIIFYYLVIPLFNNTKTFGKVIVRLKIDTENGKFLFIKLLFRNAILSLLILYPYSWLNILEAEIDNKVFNLITKLINFNVWINVISYFIAINNKHLFLYERVTKTENKSTIELGNLEKENKNEKKRDNQEQEKDLSDTSKECYNEKK